MRFDFRMFLRYISGMTVALVSKIRFAIVVDTCPLKTLFV